MKNIMKYSLGIFLVTFLLCSCESKKTDAPSSSTESAKESSTKSGNLEDQFEKDAEEMGRLICLERKASENNNSEEHSRIEGKKMLLKEKMKENYKDFIGVDKYDEKYKLHEEIGRKICSEN
jgi:hypothetical protein